MEFVKPTLEHLVVLQNREFHAHGGVRMEVKTKYKMFPHMLQLRHSTLVNAVRYDFGGTGEPIRAAGGDWSRDIRHNVGGIISTPHEFVEVLLGGIVSSRHWMGGTGTIVRDWGSEGGATIRGLGIGTTIAKGGDESTKQVTGWEEAHIFNCARSL